MSIVLGPSTELSAIVWPTYGPGSALHSRHRGRNARSQSAPPMSSTWWCGMPWSGVTMPASVVEDTLRTTGGTPVSAGVGPGATWTVDVPLPHTTLQPHALPSPPPSPLPPHTHALESYTRHGDGHRLCCTPTNLRPPTDVMAQTTVYWGSDEEVRGQPWAPCSERTLAGRSGRSGR